VNKLKIPLKLLQTLPIIAFVSLWYIYTAIFPERQFIFSSPLKFMNALYSLVVSLDLFKHGSITLIEAIAGFILGTSSGAIVGLSLWYSKTIADIAKPYIIAIGSVPVFVLAPLMIVWFGIGIFSKIMMAALSTIIVAIVQAYYGACSVDEKYLRLMQVMGASRYQTFKKVVIPSALIWVVNSMKLNIGFALLGAFIGEFISSEYGLGYIIVKSAGLYDMANVFVGCFALIVIALGLSFFVEVLEKRLLSWKFSLN